MVALPRVVPVVPDSELGRIMDEASTQDVVLEKNGVRFRLARANDDPLAEYDPERAQAAWQSTAGMLRSVDADALIADLREQRGQDSNGRPDW